MGARHGAFVLLAPLLAACFESSVGPRAPALPVTMTGTIQNLNGATIPANARVLVLWGVSAASPDYSYVWGEGTLTQNGTFSITFEENPPAAALNANQLGVGLLLLTTDQTLSVGQLPADYQFDGLLGISENHSVIFAQNLTGAAAKDWPGRFAGFGVGEVERRTTGFDTFKPVGLDALRIVVDELTNLTPPNWT